MNEKRLIYIVDDDAAVRRSVKFMLVHAGFQTKEMGSGVEFLRDVEATEPGCVLLDVRMPGMDGLEVQQQMIERGVDMPIIILTGHGDIEIAVKAMSAGASSFIEKPYGRDALLKAIDDAFTRLENGSMQSSAASEANAALTSLSQGEREVLNSLKNGRANKAIAHDLGISARTVEIQQAHIMEKLRVSTLAEALRIAFIAEANGTGASE